ncbi:uncharacterized protein LOC100372485 [Saccoglossus kowalevskii]|uniref:Uncharacterized protein LOC100372485 n=1 Tax=Saccoglossus kowalevskii TaxID=10224 RepID=A0ABM0GUQ4_SACKO|nr:PREDICTED: uncharacterized protein LOC100372485 [Saccoglossus kowalevskii]
MGTQDDTLTGRVLIIIQVFIFIGFSNAGYKCTDDCAYSHDNLCDDGGVDSYSNYCYLGSDCDDCGPREVPDTTTVAPPTTPTTPTTPSSTTRTTAMHAMQTTFVHTTTAASEAEHAHTTLNTSTDASKTTDLQTEGHETSGAESTHTPEIVTDVIHSSRTEYEVMSMMTTNENEENNVTMYNIRTEEQETEVVDSSTLVGTEIVITGFTPTEEQETEVVDSSTLVGTEIVTTDFTPTEEQETEVVDSSILVGTEIVTTDFTPTEEQETEVVDSSTVVGTERVTTDFTPTEEQETEAVGSSTLVGTEIVIISFTPTEEQETEVVDSSKLVGTEIVTTDFTPTEEQETECVDSSTLVSTEIATNGFKPTEEQETEVVDSSTLIGTETMTTDFTPTEEQETEVIDSSTVVGTEIVIISFTPTEEQETEVVDKTLTTDFTPTEEQETEVVDSSTVVGTEIVTTDFTPTEELETEVVESSTLVGTEIVTTDFTPTEEQETEVVDSSTLVGTETLTTGFTPTEERETEVVGSSTLVGTEIVTTDFTPTEKQETEFVGSSTLVGTETMTTDFTPTEEQETESVGSSVVVGTDVGSTGGAQTEGPETEVVDISTVVHTEMVTTGGTPTEEQETEVVGSSTLVGTEIVTTGFAPTEEQETEVVDSSTVVGTEIVTTDFTPTEELETGVVDSSTVVGTEILTTDFTPTEKQETEFVGSSTLVGTETMTTDFTPTEEQETEFVGSSTLAGTEVTTTGFTPTEEQETESVGSSVVVGTDVGSTGGAQTEGPETEVVDISTVVHTEMVTTGGTPTEEQETEVVGSSTVMGTGVMTTGVTQTEKQETEIVGSSKVDGTEVVTSGLMPTVEDGTGVIDSSRFASTVKVATRSTLHSTTMVRPTEEDTESTTVVLSTLPTILAVYVTSTEVQMADDSYLREWSDSVALTFDLKLSTNESLQSVSLNNDWKLIIYIRDVSSTNETVNERLRPYEVEVDNFQISGSDLVFNDIIVNMNLSGLLCSEMTYICIELIAYDGNGTDLVFIREPVDCVSILCRGVEIAPFVDVVTGSKLREGMDDQSFQFNLILYPDPEAGSIEGEYLWTLTSFFSQSNDGYGNTDAGTVHSLTTDQSGMSLYSGIPASWTGFRSSAINITDKLCSDVSKYFCVNISKSSLSNPDFTFGNPVMTCTPTPCTGVDVVDTRLSIVSGIVVKEHESSQYFNVFVTLLSSPDFGDIEGASLWNVTMYVNTQGNANVGDVSALAVADIPRDMRDLSLLAGSNAILEGVEAFMDLAELNCRQIRYLCVDVSRDQTSVPAFTLTGKLQTCAEITCRGVEITDTELIVKSGTSIVERSGNHSVTFDVLLSSNPAAASISGDRLWEMYVYLSDVEFDDTHSFAATYPVLSSVEDTDLTAGVTLALLGIEAFLDIDSLTCDQMRYICVTVFKGRYSSPEYTLTGVPDQNILTACQPVTCTGVIISTDLQLSDDFYLLEGVDNQHISYTMTLFASSAGAGVSGMNLWDIRTQLRSIEDAIVDTSNGTIQEVNTTLNAGGVLLMSNVKSVLSLEGVLCHQFFNICAILNKNSNANTEYTIEYDRSTLVSCRSVSCKGVEIIEVAPTIMNGDIVAEADDAHAVSINVGMTSSIYGTNRTGAGSWALEVFVTSDDVRMPKLVNLYATLTAAQQDTELIGGIPSVLSNIEVELDVSALQCSEFTQLCVVLHKGDNAEPDFTLGVLQDENALPGCAHLSCQRVAFNISAINVTTSSFTIRWDEAVGDFDGYYIDVSPALTGLSSSFITERDEPREASFFDLESGQEYVISVGIAKNGFPKSTGVTQYTQRTFPEKVDSLRVSMVTETEIHVVWDRPDGVVSTYVISIQPSEGTATLPITLPSDSTTASFSGLSPMSQYVITIVTYAGSLQSKEVPVKVITGTIPPVLEVTSFTMDTITVATYVDNRLSHGMLHLSYFPTDAEPIPIELDLNKTSYVITDLVPGRLYTLEVKIVADIDGGRITSNSDRKYQQTEPSPPGSIVVSRITEFGAIVNWEPSSGDFNFYLVTYSSASVNTALPIRVNHGQTPQLSLSGLSPATVYTVHVSTRSGELTSQSVSTTFNTLLAPPGRLSVNGVTSSSVQISWLPAISGLAVEYYVTYAPFVEGATPASPFTLNGTSVNITNLYPFTIYTVTVQTRIDDMYSRERGITATTYPDLPSSVKGFNVTVESPYQVTLTIQQPSFANGILESYIVNVVGYKEGFPPHILDFEIPPDETDDITEYLLEDVIAGYTYTFTVKPQNSLGIGPLRTAGQVIMPIYPPPKPTASRITANVRFVETTAYTLRIHLSNNLFDDRFGIIVAYLVIIAEDGGEYSPLPEVLPSYDEVIDSSPWPPYQTSQPFNPFETLSIGRRRRNTLQTVNYIIGAKENCDVSLVYCNGALRPVTDYRYVIRGYNELGNYTDTDWSLPQKTDLDPFWILYGVIAGLILIGIIILICICYCCCCRRRRSSTQDSDKLSEPPSYTPYACENGVFFNGNEPTLEKTEKLYTLSLRRKRKSRPVPLKGFRDYVNELDEDDRKGFEEEYDDLRKLVVRQPTSVGQRMEHRSKNRYTNIVPYDNNRVILSGSGNSYINASYISGSKGSRSYIATQGPLESTCGDFWKMIWQQRVTTVVMMTQCNELGKSKCHHYWPRDTQTQISHSDLTIRLTSETRLPDWIIRDFSIESNGEIRALRQFHFTSWPITGTPYDADPLIRFIEAIRIQVLPNSGPILVHCSAGVGRTGVFIALYHLLEYFYTMIQVDIFGKVIKMRKQRPFMVQTQGQYEFLYYAIQQHIKEKPLGTNWSMRKTMDSNWTITYGGTVDPDDSGPGFFDPYDPEEV